MKYIYDVKLNFNNYLYDFYEWYKGDKIENIKSIPIFKISKKDLYNLVNYKCKVSKEFLNNIYNKTITYYSKIEYASLFTDSYRIIGILFDRDGNTLKYSSMILDVEDDIHANLSNKLYKLNYKIISKIDIPNKLRYLYKINNYNKKYLDNLYNNKKYDEIEYLYRECMSCYNIKNIKDKYLELINSNIDNKLYKIILDTNKKKLNNLSS